MIYNPSRRIDYSRQLDFLEKNYGLVRRDEFCNFLVGKAALPTDALLTFDDGLSDHTEFVFPELDRRDVAGLVYVSTCPYLSKKLLNVHRIHYLLGLYGGRALRSRVEPAITPEMIIPDRKEKFEAAYQTQINDDSTLWIKKTFNYFLKDNNCQRILEQLMADAPVAEDLLCSRFYLAPDQIRKLQNNGMIIGTHPITHRVMSTLDHADKEHEIKSSFEYLEKITGGLTQRTYCHPTGRRNTFNDDTIEIVTQLKCGFSFSLDSRDITAADWNDKCHALPRFDCNEFAHGQRRKADD